MSQEGLAAELGVNPWTVSAWETGDAKPRSWNQRRIVDWLGFPAGVVESQKL
ncbi:MAG: helix-turn-helix domain-containing protein [Verrucomicrobiaceae bacterium]|nr:helix-turn-helix domain-containing protein [Verrucomicrobiaceae bacterium]